MLTYQRLLSQRPIALKSVLGAALAGTGDATAQWCEQQQQQQRPQSGDSPELSRLGDERDVGLFVSVPAWYDTRRWLAITSLGMVWNGPFMHVYFNWLERRFPQGAAHDRLRNLLCKTAFNQLLTNPLVYLPLFYSWTGLVYGRAISDTAAKARREYRASLYATWAIFTPVNLVNFYFTPVRHQVSVNILASFVYNTSLSLLAAPREADSALQGLSRSVSGARELGSTRAGTSK